MEIFLNNSAWKVKGYWPNVPFLGKSLEVGNELLGVTDWIDATVPGGVHFDLLKAGMIEDPHFEMNSLKCEWVENRWWMYKTTFALDEIFINRSLSLIFKGVDYKAHFYLNKVKLGEHEGMYEPICFDISDKVKFHQDNELVVLLENAPEEMAQIGYTSKTRTQKSRFNYKWDFSTRLVNIGIWDDVLIKVSGMMKFEDTNIFTGLENEDGFINISAKVKGKASRDFTIKSYIEFENSTVFQSEDTYVSETDEYCFNKKVTIKAPKLWYPNGMGNQPLYTVKLKVYANQGLSDEAAHFTGIRRIEYRQNEGSGEDTLPYTLVINSCPVYIKGVNVVPFDLLYGNVEKETYDKYFYLLKNANINLVRVWGGGIIEKEYFYHLCDLNGIMVWQEFIQSSSGINNVPSEEPHFLKLLEATAVQAVKTKRNHVSHSVWSGGNELTDENGVPVTYENNNIKLLKDIVEKYDPGKLFLPTSATGPNEFLNIDQPGKNHDVHGNWKYEGIERHYTVFNASDSLFHSEFGVDGMSCRETLERFLSKDNLKVSNMTDNLIWRHHGEWWDTYSREMEIFGQIEDLSIFSKASQFIQAEGLRYALEANRRRKYQNSGSVIWQFNEPWPNVSNTCMVDYYGTPKMAYYWVRKAFECVHASLRYDKLSYSVGEEFQAAVYLHNSTDEKEISISWEIIDINGRILLKEKDRITIGANSCKQIRQISKRVPAVNKSIFFVRLKVFDEGNQESTSNLYTFSQKKEEIFRPLLELNGGKLDVRNVEDGNIIKNLGTEVCLFINGVPESKNFTVLINNNFDSLFPGEEKFYKIINNKGITTIKDLKIIWRYL